MSLDYWRLLLRFCCIPENVLDILQIGFTFTLSRSHILCTIILSVVLLTLWLVQLSWRFLRLKAKLSLTIYFLCLILRGHISLRKIHITHELVVINCLIMLKQILLGSTLCLDPLIPRWLAFVHFTMIDNHWPFYASRLHSDIICLSYRWGVNFSVALIQKIELLFSSIFPISWPLLL